jgi:hypothetical protein
VNRMKIGKAMQYKELYDREKKKRGMGDAAFGRDQAVRATRYKEMKDDGRARLHPARWEREPFVEPREYWSETPLKRDQVFRHLQLAHLGAEGQIRENVIVRMHDTQLDVTLGQMSGPDFVKTSQQGRADDGEEPKSIWQIHEALLNYATAMHSLWPFNYAHLVIQRILVESRFGETVCAEEKDRVRC